MQIHDFFMTLDLPIYGKVGLIEGKGIHWFNAMSESQKSGKDFIKCLALQLLVVDGNFVNEEFLDNMNLKDINYVMNVISTMIDNDFKI